ncbi:MAG: UDP-N-acetylmuramoyl-L-alanyl-D-glutamate--2,6-diaminopimelate ligase [Candidatus Peribacteraceae bacterium]
MKALLKRLFPDNHPLRIAAHRLKNQLIALSYGYPAKKLIVIGVTGSDGKTTTVGMIGHILRPSGKKVAMVSTAYFDIDGVVEPNPTQKTSVDAGTLQRFLKRVVASGCTHAVIEASSHGLVQGRLAGIRPSVAVITNLSMEHLDYHGTMEEYMLAKALLFRALTADGTKVLNADDRTYHAYSGIPSAKTISYGMRETADVHASSIVSGPSSVTANLGTKNNERASLSLRIPGSFNIENALAAIASTSVFGVTLNEATQALASFTGVAGRIEPIVEGQSFAVYIDFTVTPRAYEQTLLTIRESMKGSGKLLVLAGSCGDRMREKRPLVGEICTRLADITIVTNEDPYTEDPEKIIDEVLSGVPASVPIVRSFEECKTKTDLGHVCLRLSDRMNAIDAMLALAKPGDALLFAGKGSDVTMMTKTGQIPWNEREILREKLARS